MNELKECNPNYIYVTIPTDYLCIYYRILNLLADYGIESIKDCKANCSDKNCSVIECFNMFNCAVACRKLGKNKEAALIIKYIDAKLNQLDKSNGNVEFTFNVDNTCHHKGLANSSNLSTVKIDKNVLEAIEQYNRDIVLYCDNDNTDEDCCCHKHWFIPIFTPNTYNVYDKDLHKFQSEINRWLIDKIKNIQTGGIDEETLKKLIEEYLKENPCDCEGSGSGLSEEQIKELIKKVLEDYEFSSGDCDCDIDDDAIKKAVEEYFKENPPSGSVDKETIKQLVKEVLKELDFTEEIKDAVEKWVKENNKYFQDILQPMVDDAVNKAKEEIFKELQEYLHNTERVIANALARHEQAITELQV